MKIQNKREFKQIAINNLPDFKYITKTFKKYIAEQYSFFGNNTILRSGHPFQFRKKF